MYIMYVYIYNIYNVYKCIYTYCVCLSISNTVRQLPIPPGDCTYNTKYAGEIRIDQLVGIGDLAFSRGALPWALCQRSDLPRDTAQLGSMMQSFTAILSRRIPTYPIQLWGCPFLAVSDITDMQPFLA